MNFICISLAVAGCISEGFMNKLCYALFLSAISLSGTMGASAQNIAVKKDSLPTVYKVLGKVLDQSIQTPVEMATIKIMQNEHPEISRLAQSDSLGNFVLMNLKKGNYTLNISVMGYVPMERSVIIDESRLVYDLGTLLLVTDQKLLNEVAIKGSKQLVENKPGKALINVQNKIFVSSNTAFDVLQKTPGLTLTGGSFKINGNVQPDILVNGHRTPLSADELKSISYKDIEQIEIISNPGTRYEGDRKAIINIILKKKVKQTGYNGSVFGELNRNKYMQSAFGGDFALKQEKYTLNLSAGSIHAPGFTDLYSNRFYEQNGQDYVLNTTSYIKNQVDFDYYNGSFEYEADSLNTIGFSFRGNSSPTSQSPVSTSGTYLGSVEDHVLAALVQTSGQSKIKSTNSTATLNYEHRFHRKDTKLNFEGNYGYYDLSQDQKTSSTASSDPGNALGIINEATSTIRLGSANLDFQLPLSKKLSFQTGAKFTASATRNGLVSDSIKNDIPIAGRGQVNNFKYDENIFAAYVNFTYDLDFAILDAGLRLESTDATGVSSDGGKSFTKNYQNYLPAVQLYKKWTGQSLTVSFSKKISRPSYRDLNPFVFIIDPYTYVSGNPALNTSTYENYKIDYSYRSVNIGLSYRNQRNLINQLPTLDSATNILTYALRNLDSKQNFSLDVSFPVKIASWWSLQNSTTVLHDHYESQFAGSSFSKDKLNLKNNLVNTFTISKDFYINSVFYYSSPTVFNFYDVKQISALDIGLQKDFLDKKLSLSANANDIFRGRKDVLSVDYLNLHSYLSQFANTRSYSVRLTYSFGNNSISGKSKMAKKTEEQNRVKNSFN